MLQTDDRSPAGNSLSRTPRLVVPAGLLVDDATRDRLARQLEHAPDTVMGVAAALGPIPPGSSYRVHAEWKSLEPLDAAEPATSNTVQGAVLLRHGVEYRVDGRSVEIGRGPLLLDPGTHVHDPRAPVGDPSAADAHGQSPFPRRPLVVFLSSLGDMRLADWTRGLVNRLVQRDIEGRLVLPVVSEGLHLTRPAAPSEASIRALAPAAIVALDAAAAQQAQDWCGENRSTVVIELDRTLSTTIELVSWQIGRASGRLRARIGPRVEAPALGALVRRLCSGPQPVAPRDRPTRAPSQHRAVHHAPTRTCAIVTGDVEPSTEARLAALSDHMRAAGLAVTTVAIEEGLPSGISDASLVILSGSELGAALEELVAARRELRQPTVFDLQACDLRGLRDGAPELIDAAAALADACGLATSFGGALHHAITRLGVRALAVPTLLTRRRGAELRAARNRSDPSELVIGWNVGTPGRGTEQYLEAAAVGLAKVVADHRDVRVQATCEPDDVPARARALVRATEEYECAGDEMGTWTVHLFTPAAMGEELADDVLPFTVAGHAGVPTVLPGLARSAIDGFVPPALVIQDANEPEQWSTALHHVLEDTRRRAQLSAEACRRADAIDAAATSKAIVNRLVGWARFEAAVERPFGAGTKP